MSPSERIQRRIDGLLDEAEAAADNGNWTDVVKAVEAVLSADPDNDDAKVFRNMASPYVSGEAKLEAEPGLEYRDLPPLNESR